jgi:electron-transferring-flavoprotein dehydrogenase
MDFDMVIVGAGPAGLSCAIRSKQVNPNLSVCVVDKGSEIGSHILSGNVFEPRALDELIPDWRRKEAPINVPVRKDNFFLLPNQRSKIGIPHSLFPQELDNSRGNYIISLGELCKWLSVEAEAVGVEIYPGFAISDPIYDETKSKLVGVRTIDTGIAKDRSHKANYSPGMDLMAKQVVLAEGARGSVSEKVITHFSLRKDSLCPPTFSLGLKEVWEVVPSNHDPGSVSHAVGFPFSDPSVYAGSFVYHLEENLVHLGLVIGLDYRNPHLNMHSSLQLFKTHDWLRNLLAGGRCLSYGARVLSVGGYQALPKLSFPGGVLVGCSAGFLNLAKIKGTHTAMKSGMFAGEVCAESISKGEDNADLLKYEAEVKNSWVGEELHRVRNIKPAFKLGGMLGGLAYSGVALNILKGKEPWTLKWKKLDCDKTQPVKDSKPIEYPKPDGKLTFDILDNVSRTGVRHEHDQPSHLKVKKQLRYVAEKESYEVYGGPESRFCPAKVYEYPDGKLQINAQNCIHCKCCSIKTPHEFIEWTVPEGGGGPQYSGM